MKPVEKILLVIEVAICFFPILIVLILGTFFLPQQIYFLFAYGEVGSLIPIGLTLGGWFGMVSLLVVVEKILDPLSNVIDSRVILVFMSLGILSLVIVDQIGLSGQYRIMSILPILCALHICYLGRRYLFGL